MATEEKTIKSPSDLCSNGIFMLGDVDEESCTDAITFILEANLDESVEYDHLTLIINSHGGSVTDGFALIDIMQGSRIPIWTVGIGMLASMGLIIFMAGEKGCRYLTPRTLILSHQWWSINWGKEHELVAARKKNELISNMVLQHYKKFSKLKKEKDIRKVLLPESDVWLNCDEALKYGLCDAVKLL